ncbi:MAG TPA: hypothetical protein VGR09_00685 [Gemmatimonadales bacterium]|nr:hypothetical protein [Gemmatimonadales bacterium]
MLTATGLCLLPAPCASQSAGARTYCNPIDIDYKYNFEQLNEGISYRSGADPVIVNHKGEYYLSSQSRAERLGNVSTPEARLSGAFRPPRSPK